jgi:transcription elongation factor Elf1
MNQEFDIIVPVRCEYCGHNDEFNITAYSRKAETMNSYFDWVCPKCKKVAKPIFSCRMHWNDE